MFFHVRRVYDRLTGKARTSTAVAAHGLAMERWLDTVLALSRRVSGASGPYVNEADFQARFEKMAPVFAAALIDMDETRRGQAFEGMVKRLEVGLLEGRLVGDMKLGPKVRTYSQALHGRVQRYGPLLAGGDWAGLEAALTAHGVADAGLYVQSFKKELAAAAKVG